MKHEQKRLMWWTMERRQARSLHCAAGGAYNSDADKNGKVVTRSSAPLLNEHSVCLERALCQTQAKQAGPIRPWNFINKYPRDAEGFFLLNGCRIIRLTQEGGLARTRKSMTT